MHDFVIRLHSVRDVNDFVTLSAPTVHAECTEEEFHRFFQESQRFLLL